MMEHSAQEHELWQRYKASGKTSDKNKLVMHYMPAVKKTALRLIAHLSRILRLRRYGQQRGDRTDGCNREVRFVT